MKMNETQQTVAGLTASMVVIEFIGIAATLGFRPAAVLAFLTLTLGTFIVWWVGKITESHIDTGLVKKNLFDLVKRAGQREAIRENELAALREEILKGNRREREIWGSHFNMVLTMIQANSGKIPLTARID